eukprot:6296170-Lingulodinium_polyedra.AAC.1
MRGTRAGDPLGDMLFNLIEAKVLELAERIIVDEGLATHVPIRDGAGPLAVQDPVPMGAPVPAVQLSYVDDA